MRATLIIGSIFIASIAGKPNGFYHQEYNYQTSSSSFKNHELQHKNEDQGYYSRDGDLEGHLRPKVNAHSEHNEYVNPKLQHGYQLGTDRTSSFGQLHAQNLYGGMDYMGAGANNYRMSSNLNQLTANLQQDMEQDLRRAVYEYQTSAGYNQAQFEAHKRMLHEELKRNMTMRLQDALRAQYGNQGIRGAYSYSITNGRLQPTANYDNQELSDLTKKMEGNLMGNLDQQLQRLKTTYQTKIDTAVHTQKNTYQKVNDNYGAGSEQQYPVYQPRPFPDSRPYVQPKPYPEPIIGQTPIIYQTPIIQQEPIQPAQESLTTVATRVQTDLNEHLNRILKNVEKQYFSSNSYQMQGVNYDHILAQLQNELRANITGYFDQHIKQAYGYYQSKYTNEDVASLRRQIETNLITKLNRDFNSQRQSYYQKYQTFQITPNSQGYYPSNIVQYQNQDINVLQKQLQNQLSQQLQTALMRQSHYNSQANYQSVLDELSAELNRNLTLQLNQLNARQYQNGMYDTQISNMRNQLQQNLMRQLQQGLQQSWSRYSSWSSSSSSSSTGGANYRPVRGFDPNLYHSYGSSDPSDCMQGDDPSTYQQTQNDNDDLTQVQTHDDLTQQTEDNNDLTQQVQTHDDLTQQTEDNDDLTQQVQTHDDLTQQTEDNDDLTQQVQTHDDLTQQTDDELPQQVVQQTQLAQEPAIQRQSTYALGSNTRQYTSNYNWKVNTPKPQSINDPPTHYEAPIPILDRARIIRKPSSNRYEVVRERWSPIKKQWEPIKDDLTNDNLNQQVQKPSGLTQQVETHDNLAQQVQTNDDLTQQVQTSDDLTQQVQTSDNLAQLSVKPQIILGPPVYQQTPEPIQDRVDLVKLPGSQRYKTVHERWSPVNKRWELVPDENKQNNKDFNQKSHTDDDLTQQVQTNDDLTQQIQTDDDLTQQTQTSDELTQQVQTSDNLAQLSVKPQIILGPPVYQQTPEPIQERVDLVKLPGSQRYKTVRERWSPVNKRWERVPDEDEQNNEDFNQKGHTDDDLTQQVQSNDDLRQQIQTDDDLTQQVQTSDDLTQQVQTSDDLAQPVQTNNQMSQKPNITLGPPVHQEPMPTSVQRARLVKKPDGSGYEFLYEKWLPLTHEWVPIPKQDQNSQSHVGQEIDNSDQLGQQSEDLSQQNINQELTQTTDNNGFTKPQRLNSGSQTSGGLVRQKVEFFEAQEKPRHLHPNPHGYYSSSYSKPKPHKQEVELGQQTEELELGQQTEDLEQGQVLTSDSDSLTQQSIDTGFVKPQIILQKQHPSFHQHLSQQAQTLEIGQQEDDTEDLTQQTLQTTNPKIHDSSDSETPQTTWQIGPPVYQPAPLHLYQSATLENIELPTQENVAVGQQEDDTEDLTQQTLQTTNHKIHNSSDIETPQTTWQIGPPVFQPAPPQFYQSATIENVEPPAQQNVEVGQQEDDTEDLTPQRVLPAKPKITYTSGPGTYRTPLQNQPTPKKYVPQDSERLIQQEIDQNHKQQPQSNTNQKLLETEQENNRFIQQLRELSQKNKLKNQQQVPPDSSYTREKNELTQVDVVPPARQASQQFPQDYGLIWVNNKWSPIGTKPIPPPPPPPAPRPSPHQTQHLSDDQTLPTVNDNFIYPTKPQDPAPIGPMHYVPQPVYANIDGHQVQVGTTRQLPSGRSLVQHQAIEIQEQQPQETVQNIEDAEPQTAHEVIQVKSKHTNPVALPAVEAQPANVVEIVEEPTTTAKPGFWSRVGSSIKNKASQLRERIG